MNNKADDHQDAHGIVDPGGAAIAAEQADNAFAPVRGIQQAPHAGDRLDQEGHHDKDMKEAVKDIKPDYSDLVIHFSAPLGFLFRIRPGLGFRLLRLDGLLLSASALASGFGSIFSLMAW